jgi:hypothetical protein
MVFLHNSEYGYRSRSRSRYTILSVKSMELMLKASDSTAKVQGYVNDITF